MNDPWYIVGGGIIGLICARELHQAGESVVVLDRQTVGQESSWAGGGILSPLYPWRYPGPVSVLSQWSQAFYPTLAQHLSVHTGIDPEWTASGLLFFDEDNSQSAETWAASAGVALESLSRAAFLPYVPSVSNDFDHALWMPQVAQIRNPRLLRALCADLRQSGVEIRENVTVHGFAAQGGRLAAIRTDAGDIATERCLVAAGAWSGDLLASTGIHLPVTPVKGQMLLLSAPAVQLKAMVIKDNRYIIPRRDGRLLVGSTLELSGYDKSTTDAACADLLQAAAALIPALATCPVERQWAGLRPGSPDGVPFIGEHPDMAGLFVCAGHFRNGIVLAPASARLVTDLMLGRAPTFDPGPYQLSPRKA